MRRPLSQFGDELKSVAWLKLVCISNDLMWTLVRLILVLAAKRAGYKIIHEINDLNIVNAYLPHCNSIKNP